MKVCSKCGLKLPIEMFSKGNGSLGLRYECKSCVRDYNLKTNSMRQIRQTTYNKINKDSLSIKRKARYLRDKTSERAQQLVYSIEHREEANARALRWARSNPDRANARTAKHKARKLNAPIGYMPSEPLKELIKIYGPKCIVPTCYRLADTVDHVIALANGGADAFDNLQPMCRPCNCSKGAWHNTDYRIDYNSKETN